MKQKQARVIASCQAERRALVLMNLKWKAENSPWSALLCSMKSQRTKKEEKGEQQKKTEPDDDDDVASKKLET